MRFIDNQSFQQMYLSNHAIGNAFDADVVYSPDEFLPRGLVNDAYFGDYIEDRTGLRPGQERGWQQNIEYAQLFNAFPQYMDDRLEEIGNTIDALSGVVGMGSVVAAYRAEENQIRAILEADYDYPTLQIGMDEIFVESMRRFFTWGGDWRYYKDYLHFEGP